MMTSTGTALEFDLVDSDSSPADSVKQSTYTFSGMLLGAADSNRLILITVATNYDGQSSSNNTTVTVGGSSTTKYLDFINPDSPGRGISIHHATVATGTTADIVITTSPRNIRDVSIAVYRAIGFSSTADDTFTSSSNTADISLSVSANDSIVLAVMNGNGNGLTNNYTNLTVDYEDPYNASGDTYVHYSASGVASGTFTAESSDPAHSTYTVGAVVLNPA